MIPGEIFTSFSELHGIVIANDFGFPVGLQELLPASLAFLWSFCFRTDTSGSIGWPSPATRLHIGDCFEIRNCRLGPCDLLLSSHQKFQHEVRAPPLRLLHGALVILVFYRSRSFGLKGNECKLCVYTNAHVSWMWALKMLHERNWRWESPCSGISSSTKFSEFLQPLPNFRK